MVCELFDGPADGARFHPLQGTDRVAFTLEDGRYALYVRFAPGRYQFKGRARIPNPELLSAPLRREK